MHGDDAGSSARLVWVVHPSRVAVHDGGGGLLGGSAVDQLAVAKGAAMMNNEGNVSPGRDGNNFSYTQKFGELRFNVFLVLLGNCCVLLASCISCLVSLKRALFSCRR